MDDLQGLKNITVHKLFRDWSWEIIEAQVPATNTRCILSMHGMNIFKLPRLVCIGNKGTVEYKLETIKINFTFLCKLKLYLLKANSTN
jgi:hypothetical protein